MLSVCVVTIWRYSVPSNNKAGWANKLWPYTVTSPYFGRLHFWSSSFLVLLIFGRLHCWSSSLLVVFIFGRLHFWSSSFWVVFILGRLPFLVRSSSILGEVVKPPYLWNSLLAPD